MIGTIYAINWIFAAVFVFGITAVILGAILFRVDIVPRRRLRLPGMGELENEKGIKRGRER